MAAPRLLLPRRLLSRRALLAGTAAAALPAPAVIGQTKSPHAGTTLRGAAFSLPFHSYLKNFIPEFEEKTGIKVVFDVQAFPIYNQRMDLELSTKGSTYDICNVTYIYTSRWINAGWLTNLDQFTSDKNATAPDWNPADFLVGAQQPMRDSKGGTYGYTIESGAMIMYAARGDLIEKAGLKMPTTMDELVAVCDAIHGKEGVAAFTADKLHHWNFIPYLMGFGGTVIKDPPRNITPALDNEPTAKAAQWYADMLTRFGVPGLLSYTDDQAMLSQLSGRANIRTQSITWGLPLVTHADSKVKDTVRYALMPAGAKGAFPGANSHAYGIPAGSRKKAAAWEFIQWALSKQTMQRVVDQYGYPSVARRSVIDSPAYRKALTLNGQDVASLYLAVLDRAATGNYMGYRTIPVFPQVGDKINRAIEAIATKQMDAPTAMKQAQAQAVDDIRKAGYSVDG